MTATPLCSKGGKAVRWDVSRNCDNKANEDEASKAGRVMPLRVEVIGISGA